MKIEIIFIPHENQRYPTLGDYWVDTEGNWQIRVSEMGDIRSMVAVALHELFEMGSIMHKKIPIKVIDEFDMAFEKEREEGKVPPDAEPGHDPRAPYLLDHVNAELVEWLYCTHTGLMWNLHEENCELA